MNQWREPQHSTKAVPTLRLLFPSWGLSLDDRQRAKFEDKWNKNDVLIPAHSEMVTVVSFVTLDNGITVRREEGSPPITPFGVLKLGPDKSLFVIASYQPEGDLKVRADAALKKIPRQVEVELSDGEDLVVCLTGNTAKNSAFILPLSVRYHRRGA